MTFEGLTAYHYNEACAAEARRFRAKTDSAGKIAETQRLFHSECIQFLGHIQDELKYWKEKKT